ncbi:hypothetical protein [Nubsella zeaxanthinifaciens]|uniref:hypothetical protein n=1 Tax=Nubsella zeaxanthinifaciens TaxID=392412 RepID=UPI000DE3AC99|nr:hypothetical protein [Nubsella zeaxanthinifaciens]
MPNRQVVKPSKNHQNVTNKWFCQRSIISKTARKNKPIINQLIKQKTAFLARLTNFQLGTAFELQLSNGQIRSLIQHINNLKNNETIRVIG